MDLKPPPIDRTFFVGVDLGQRGSYTAIVVLERFDEQPDFNSMLRGQGFRRRYIVRQAERVPLGTPYSVPLGTPYSEVVNRLETMTDRLSQRGLCIVVVDESSGGIPVVELMRKQLKCRIVPIMITSGQTADSSGSVPRTVLITKMQVMAEQKELEISAGCRDFEALIRELAHLTLDRGSSGEPDDLALGLSLSCWKAKVR